MKTIDANNVNDALTKGIVLINNYGVKIPSRNGDTLEVSEPVAITYNRPWERVLFSPLRDANHFFQFFESLWMIAGRNDVGFVSEFNSNIKNYSDNGQVFNGAYGYRAKEHFSVDQFKGVIEVLLKDMNSRQAVVQLWCPFDLHKTTLDKCCNMEIVFRVRGGQLYMTVYNRSNDMIWGAFGANLVHFSMIQEYIAAHLNLPMGPYTQVSNAFHVYTDVNSEATGMGAKMWDKLNTNDFVFRGDKREYMNHVRIIAMMTNETINYVDRDLKQFFKLYDDHDLEEILFTSNWKSKYFNKLVLPMLNTWVTHKKYGAKQALKTTSHIIADDWRIGCENWLTKRVK